MKSSIVLLCNLFVSPHPLRCSRPPAVAVHYLLSRRALRGAQPDPRSAAVPREGGAYAGGVERTRTSLTAVAVFPL